ncbi:MAG: DUF2231 domain-containing protein [Gemmatimonadales bacterium]|nr:DUF2231 domain-containing protein [Gemmatimonadales bacterium]
MFGYDWPRLHAALNDFPAALLLVSVLFDMLGIFTKRDSLKAAGFWTLVVGVLGTGAAILAGLMAEDVIEHSDQAHAVMETHETLGIIVLVLFGLLALWRIVRRGVWGEKEQPVALTAGVIGVALMVYTSKIGGSLMFDHALGIKAAQMHEIIEQRGGEQHEHEEGEEAPAPGGATGADSMKAMAPDSARPQAHTDSTPHPHQ